MTADRPRLSEVAFSLKQASLGYDDFNDDVRIANSVQSTIYHLVFASKHKRGTEFWRKISRRKFSGQARMDLA